jgi:CDGSH-type Zn-finger protein
MTAVEIKVKENGPLVVSGPITILDVEGNEYELPAGTAYALCRCGASANKPFCDKSHQRIGFVAASDAKSLSS